MAGANAAGRFNGIQVWYRLGRPRTRSQDNQDLSILPFQTRRKKRFEALVQPHLEGMYRFAFRLTGQQQDAEDLVQDVVVKLYPRLSELESVDQLRPWLNRVLYRQFVDQLRRRNRQGEHALTDLVDGDGQNDWLDTLDAEDDGPVSKLARAQLGPALDEALSTLAPDQRALLLLHDVDGWRQEDIADVLGIPLGTVKSRLHRLRSALRKRLQRRLEPVSGSERVGK
ncbi:MAG: RNA polymerase subunit sigma-24 [Oceanospirillales bacterium]|jgi:RNA polymerase sigma-70 factor (ECF subfamily)|nr:RNA polymerase subunit sigma-24 [Marinobacter sp.]MBI43528.1 RNA polymerase subunit sigma-24 [Oceanospirillales bacterium]NVD36073.1 RNA polymerase sigma factor [Marinobacter lutaoensis]|tara:strand:+ start:721 stop:1401 length:681 start_codon:yes stop_codon:yes gene_type:complete